MASLLNTPSPSSSTEREYFWTSSTAHDLTSADNGALPRVVRVDAVPEEERKGEGTHSVVLSSTLFHPQGGGQPSDVGFLRVGGGGDEDSSPRVFEVLHVSTDPGSGEIAHVGAFVGDGGEANIPVGSRVACEIDAQKRTLHARLHSGGHLCDIAVRSCGFDYLVPGKVRRALLRTLMFLRFGFA
jgi:alanyl-tRNA synthetase